MLQPVPDDRVVNIAAPCGEEEIDGAGIVFGDIAADESFVDESGDLPTGCRRVHRTRLGDLSERNGALIGEAPHDRVAGAGDDCPDRCGLAGVEPTVGAESEQSLE